MNHTTSTWGQVDQSDSPADFADYLDTVTALGEIQRYKEKTYQLLQPPRAGAWLLDIGCGVGDDVRALADRIGWGGVVIGIDNSTTLIAEARRRHQDDSGRIDFRVAEADRLPFANGAFDGCRADRVFMHLPHREAVLQEMIRITRPGGRLVVNDPDWDTLVIDHPDTELTRTILRAMADHTTHPQSGRQLARLFLAHGLTRVEVADTATLVLTDFATADRLYLIQERVQALISEGKIETGRGTQWLADLKSADRAGTFFSAVTGFTVVGQKP